MASKKKSYFKKIILSFGGVVLAILLVTFFIFWQKIYSVNVIGKNEKQFLYVPTGTTAEQLFEIISQKKIVNSIETFRWAAEWMKLADNIHPGKYELKKGMSNYELVKLLRSGKQTPVKLVINKFRTRHDLAIFISAKLEIDSTEILDSLNSNSFTHANGFTPESIIGMFIPNTYEFYWNTTITKFILRMKREYDGFWNSERRQKASAHNLSVLEICTLASIIDEETNQNDEKPALASVYLNRLKINMMLQADPTIKFANNDFTIRRVRGTHIEAVKDSPYNTYRKSGLPPGPICTPTIAGIDAVLNADSTTNLYFCASTLKPGYHVFATNMKDHLTNAKLYQQYLNKRGIQ